MKTFLSPTIGLLSVVLLFVLPSLSLCQGLGSEPVPGLPQVNQGTAPPPFDKYPLGPDSLHNPSVKVGKTFTFDLTDSKIFPYTSHTITVYIPAAYKGDKPACVYVGLDGLHFNVPVVFDNLIAQHAMPVTIGIGLSPGSVASAQPPENPRFDRSMEFDTRSDRLARFLLEEVIPAVEHHRTPDGHVIRLSTNPNDRAIGGASTGGIGSFTVAWERPDAFHRVFIAIGTFVGMRGGEEYYVQVRKTEPKPLRIFMEDGMNDEWGGGPEIGDWWMSNQTMNRALEFAGYDVRHMWGAGTHNENHAASIFPDAMRWLWADWPTAISKGEPGNPVLKAILLTGEGWKVAADDCVNASHLASNPRGQVFYGAEYPLVADTAQVQCAKKLTDGAFAFGAGGGLYVTHAQGGVEMIPSHGGKGVASFRGPGLKVRELTVRSNGDAYAITVPHEGRNELWLLPANGEPVCQDRDLKGASGLAVSPDGLWLFVAQGLSRSGISYRINTDGTLAAREDFYDFFLPHWADDSGASQVVMDRDGRAYVGTRTGVQVFDRNGRVTAILPLPGNEPVTGICFGGSNFDELFVIAGDKIYKRTVKVPGAPPWAAPIKLPPWNAG